MRCSARFTPGCANSWGAIGSHEVTITCAAEAPRQEPRSGKLRQILRS